MMLVNRNLLFLDSFKAHSNTSRSLEKKQVFVVQGLKINLLGIPAITEHNLAARHTVGCSYKLWFSSKNKFPTVFQGLRNLGEPYAIQLKKHATSYAFYLARQFLIPL